jgi:NTP pyrophosphatase (non-canonical NTP hydrolase)
MSSSEEIVDELGDVLWYVTMLANRMGSSLEEVMKSSIEKLEDRALNGKKGK